MFHTVTEKHQPSEILQIIRANYIQQQQFDDIALLKDKTTGKHGYDPGVSRVD